MQKEESLLFLREKARNIRKTIIEEVYNAGSGHPGGSLSAVEILTYLYFKEMKIREDEPEWAERDRFVLSKGHASPLLYATLAEKGFFSKKDLLTFRKIGSAFQGHPCRDKVPGVDMSTGSLGQGFSAAVGMTIASRLDLRPSRTFVLLGDGELQEGLVWEAAMAAAHYNLGRLMAFIDWNGLQIDGRNDDVMRVSPIDEKFKAFGWNVFSIDGHSFNDIEKVLALTDFDGTKPTAVIAKTQKGHGVSFMEDRADWHGKAPNEEQMYQALAEIEKEEF